MASIGLHISDDSASPTVASSASDIVLLSPSLSKILILIDLSKAFHRRVVFNFTWSAIYNLIAILLAAGIIPRARIPPGYAGLGEAVSILPVLGVAVSLRFWKR
jgi:cation transport ATPase